MASDAIQSPLLASFRASYADLLRYLTRRAGCVDEAHDLAHDTWLRVADMARQGREPALGSDGEARAYLFTMARNLLIDQHRRNGVVQRHADGLGAGAGLPAPVSAQTPDAAESAMYGQAVRAVEAALAGLPERVRQVFLRHRVHGEDQATLAAAFGVSRNMIERDMMQAMDRVQVALERWHAGAKADAPAPHRTGRRRSLTALLGMAGLALGSAGGWRWWRMAMPQWQQMAATGHGQTLRRSLPDGGMVTLDAQTRVEMAFYAGWRSVRLLAGSAFFEVAADAQRPFVVDVPAGASSVAGHVRITVLGTRFGVDRSPSGGVQVQVASGRVRVDTPGIEGRAATSNELAPGMALHWMPGAQADAMGVQIGRLPASGAVAGWRHGVVAFDDAPLGEAIERLRRYLPRPVAVAPEVAGLRLSGQVRIAQAEDFVRALPGILPVRARLETGRWQVQMR